jgi:hypothetical protein
LRKGEPEKSNTYRLLTNIKLTTMAARLLHEKDRGRSPCVATASPRRSKMVMSGHDSGVPLGLRQCGIWCVLILRKWDWKRELTPEYLFSRLITCRWYRL